MVSSSSSGVMAVIARRRDAPALFDEDVDATHLGLDLRGELVDAVDVARGRPSNGAPPARLGEAIGPASADADGVTSAHELGGEGRPDARRRTRDQHPTTHIATRYSRRARPNPISREPRHGHVLGRLPRPPDGRVHRARRRRAIATSTTATTSTCTRPADEMVAIFGLGQYPNLGVTDAFVDVRIGDEPARRAGVASRSIDRMDTSVGPIRVEVIEPLREAARRRRADRAHASRWTSRGQGSGPRSPSPVSIIRTKGTVVFDTQRLAQTRLLGGHAHRRRRDDRGRRPITGGGSPRSLVGRAARRRAGARRHPQGRQRDERHVELLPHAVRRPLPSSTSTTSGPTATATLEQAERVWPDGRIEELGRARARPRVRTRARGCCSRLGADVPRAPGDRDRRARRCSPTSSRSAPATASTPTGATACTRGPTSSCRASSYKVDDIKGMRGQYGVVDHVGRFEYDGNVGYGLYEHGFFGPFERYGMTDGAMGRRRPPEHGRRSRPVRARYSTVTGDGGAPRSAGWRGSAATVARLTPLRESSRSSRPGAEGATAPGTSQAHGPQRTGTSGKQVDSPPSPTGKAVRLPAVKLSGPRDRGGRCIRHASALPTSEHRWPDRPLLAELEAA